MPGVDAATVLARVPNGLKVDATIGGITVQAVAASIALDQVATLYGLQSGYEQSLYTDADTLSAEPAAGDTIVIERTFSASGKAITDGTTYRVMGVKRMRPSTLRRLDLGEQYAN